MNKDSTGEVRKSSPEVEELFKNLNQLAKRFKKIPRKAPMAHPNVGLTKPGTENKKPWNVLSKGGSINEK